MTDLMALAIVRHMLLEMGVASSPDSEFAHAGGVEQWLHEPRTDLAGQSPFGALQSEDGVERVRQILGALKAGQHLTSDQPRR